MIVLLEWMPAAVIFFAVASGSFGILLMFRRNTMSDVHGEIPTAPEEDARPVADQLISSSTLPPNLRELQQELRSAGVYEPDAVNEFTTFRIAAALCVLACAALAIFLVDEEVAGQIFLIGVLLAALVFSLPRAMLLAKRRRQTRAMERDLPLAIDLQVLCLSAGQGLVAALRQTAAQLRRPSPILARELAIVCQHAELHSLEHALKQWSDRTASSEVRNLALLLIQSERLGTDSAATLHELATSYRINSRQRAEAQANRTSFWMLFPSVFCFWIASAIILVGPTYLEFFRHHQRSGPLRDQPSETLQSITSANGNSFITTVPASAANAKSTSK